MTQDEEAVADVEETRATDYRDMDNEGALPYPDEATPRESNLHSPLRLSTKKQRASSFYDCRATCAVQSAPGPPQPVYTWLNLSCSCACAYGQFSACACVHASVHV